MLSARKLIAEPWDATGEGYAVGGFGANWTEWNDRFRDTTRDFWRGLDGIRDLGYRLSGSSDLFAPNRRPWASINFVTAHDGFTLRDLVSYDHKHNEANGEDNRDGTDNNRSWNYGVEGETDDPAIIALRTRQARNIAATLLLSTGTPMITMGDEMWRTQGGNNNAYCQDNEISWLNWDALSGTDSGAVATRNMIDFFRRTLAIRSEAPALRQGEFFDGRAPGGGDGIPDLVWFNPWGRPMTDDDWFDGSRRTLMMWVDGRDVRGHTTGGEPLTDVSWLLVLHADGGPMTLTLPGYPLRERLLPGAGHQHPDGRTGESDRCCRSTSRSSFPAGPCGCCGRTAGRAAEGRMQKGPGPTVSRGSGPFSTMPADQNSWLIPVVTTAAATTAKIADIVRGAVWNSSFTAIAGAALVVCAYSFMV